MLVDLPYNGKMRKLVLHANRNGFFYVLDRVSGEYLNATRLVEKLEIHWPDGTVQNTALNTGVDRFYIIEESKPAVAQQQ